MSSTTQATQARPPEITEMRGVVRAATLPDSTSPTRGPPVTTSVKTADMRPRMWSGVTDCMIVVRQTALTLSAAYTWYTGGGSQNLYRDRDFLSLSAAYNF